MQATDETYNGHTNWDTWNASLWLNNDERMYRMAQWCAENLTVEYFQEECSVVLIRKGHDGKLVYGDDLDLENVDWQSVYDSFREGMVA